MPRIMKPYHLYDLADWNKAKSTGEYLYAIGTTYAKTVRGAIKTFIENHSGDFIIECDGRAEMVRLFH